MGGEGDGGGRALTRGSVGGGLLRMDLSVGVVTADARLLPLSLLLLACAWMANATSPPPKNAAKTMRQHQNGNPLRGSSREG